MTEPKLLYNVDDEDAQVRRKLDDYLGVLAPKRDEPARTCDLFDPETCPYCDHYPECAARDLDE